MRAKKAKAIRNFIKVHVGEVIPASEQNGDYISKGLKDIINTNPVDNTKSIAQITTTINLKPKSPRALYRKFKLLMKKGSKQDIGDGINYIAGFNK